MYVFLGEGIEIMDRLVVFLIVFFCFLVIVLKVEFEGFVYDYYVNFCFNVEKIIYDIVYKFYEKKGNIVIFLICYVFYDCFDVRFFFVFNFKFGVMFDYMNVILLFYELNDVYLVFIEL